MRDDPTTSLVRSLLKGWENVLFELGSERVKTEFRGRLEMPNEARSSALPYS